jgi:DNA mismatch repair protein MutS
VHEGDDLVAADVRHPVVERRAASIGEPFVPNDVHLDGAASQLVVLTGPNMGG